MKRPRIVSREAWLDARKTLLAKEKEATRQRDALVAERRALPMVRLLAPIVLTSGAPLHGRTRYSESDARRT